MAKSTGYCEDCEHWNHVYDTSSEKWGTCTNEWVDEKVKVSEEFNPDIDDMKGIFTERLFGCMYFEQGDRNVVVKLPVPKK
jgi:hypothetical protein